MHRTDGDGHDSNAFTDGNPSLGVKATQVDDDWLNAVQEELCNAIEADGTALAKGTNTQLRSVLASLLSAVTPGGRLTLSTGVPVGPENTATTVYYTPYKTNRIALYNGSRWVLHTFSEVSQLTTDNTKSPAAVGNNLNYDVFGWMDGSDFRTTRGPSWSSATNRGSGTNTTELEMFEGRLVNKHAITNGPAARRGLYLGTIRSNGSAQIVDTMAKRYVWNMYNRVERAMRVIDATATWDYSTSTFRVANNDSSNALDFVLGQSEDAVTAQVIAQAVADETSGVYASIGLDSETAAASGVINHATFTAAGDDSTHGVTLTAAYKAQITLGRHFLARLEKAVTVSGTITWGGSGSDLNTGIFGSVWA